MRDWSGATWEFHRNERKGLRFSTVILGGYDRLSVDIPCGAGPIQHGLPEWRSTVEVWNDNGPVWAGWLRMPRAVLKRGVLDAIHLEADGWWHSAEQLKHQGRVVYGPPATASSNQKIVITDIADAVVHSRALLCQYIPGEDIDYTGLTLEEDSESFGGQPSTSVWNYMRGFTEALVTPVYWQVWLDQNRTPTLYWKTLSGAVDYWDHGRAREAVLEFDADEVANEVLVEWGNGQLASGYGVSPLIDPNFVRPEIDYSAIKARQMKYIHVGMGIRSLNQVTGFAGGLQQRMNTLRITGGTVTLDERITGQGNSWIELEEVRAGKRIRLTKPDIKPYNVAEALIYSTEYNEDACSVTLQLGLLDEAAKNARLVAYRELQGSAMEWSVFIGKFNPSALKVWADGGTGSAFPNWTHSPGQGAAPSVRFSNPVVAVSNGQHDFGPYGSQYLPENLPTNTHKLDVVTHLGSATNGAPLTGDSNGFLAQVPVQDFRADSINIKTAPGVRGTIKIRVDRWNPTTRITDSSFMEIELDNGEYESKSLVPVGTAQPKKVDDGDYLIFYVAPGATLSYVQVGIHGPRRYPQMPHYDPPEWAPPSQERLLD